MAFLGGLAVGAMAGLLLAPETGSNTRKAIRKMAADLGDAVEDTLHDALDKVKDKYADVVEEGGHLAEQAAEKIQHVGKDIKAKYS